MKRSKQGYVLVIVMVVMLVLCSIASIIASTVTNNLKDDVIDFSKQQMKFEVQGIVERYRARLDKLDESNESLAYDATDPEQDKKLSDHVYDKLEQLRTDCIAEVSASWAQETITINSVNYLLLKSEHSERKYKLDISDPELISSPGNPAELKVTCKAYGFFIDKDGNPHEELLLSAEAKITVEWTPDNPADTCTMDYSVKWTAYEMNL